MKICPTCGNQLNDEAVFCAACGNPVPASVEAAPQAGGFEPAAVQNPGGNTKKLIAIIAAAAAVVVLIVVLCTTVFSSNAAAKRTVKSYVKALNNKDSKQIVKLSCPEPLLEYAEDEFDEDADDLADDLDEVFDEFDDAFDDDWKFSCEIKKVKDMKKGDFKDLKEDYEDEYDMEITDAKEVKVKMTIEADGEEESDTIEATVYKYKGKWYIDRYFAGDFDDWIDYID